MTSAKTTFRTNIRPARRPAAALMMALFVMTVTTVLVVSIVDTEVLQYSALRNTRDWDKARYLAEAAVQHVMAELEINIDWRAGIATTEFPQSSGNTYGATVVDGPNGTVVISAWGTSQGITRRMETTLKQGG